jgi:hypothetical protein
MSETIQASDKVVLKENFDFYLHGVGLIVPEHGKVYCVEKAVMTKEVVNGKEVESPAVFLIGDYGKSKSCVELEKKSFEARCFKKLGVNQ